MFEMTWPAAERSSTAGPPCGRTCGRTATAGPPCGRPVRRLAFNRRPALRLNLSPIEIEKKIMARFTLEQSEAEKYVVETLG